MSAPPTDPGRMLRAFGALALRVGHLDNTGAPCRIEWDGEHDACYVCNVNGALLAALRDHGLAAADLEGRAMPAMRMRAADNAYARVYARSVLTPDMIKATMSDDDPFHRVEEYDVP